MKPKAKWDCISLSESIVRKLRQALILSLLILSALMRPSTVYADDKQPGHANEGNDGYPSQHYKHSAWWIAGISAASVAGMTSNTFAEDKKRHFSLSIVLGAASETGLRKLEIASGSRWLRVALATGVGLVPGIVKEMTDDRFDKEDLLADVLGSFTGALLSDLIQGPMSTGLHYGVVVGVDEVGLAINYQF